MHRTLLLLLLPALATAQPAAVPPPPPAAEHAAPEDAPRPTTYLGVAVGGVDDVVASQLGLEEGFGLAVQRVVPESPAATAGLRRGDILVRFEDQLLTDGRQLGLLVRRHKAGEVVTVTYLRGGREATAEVTLAERTERTRPTFGWTGRAPSAEFTGEITGDVLREVGEAMRSVRFEIDADRMRAIAEEARHAAEGARREVEQQIRWIHAENPGDAPPPPPPPPAPTTVLQVNRSVMVWNDGEHSLELTNNDDVRTLSVRDAQGAVLFQGPVESEEQRAAVPESVRGKLERLMNQVRIDHEAPRPREIRIVPPAPPAPGAPPPAPGGRTV